MKTTARSILLLAALSVPWAAFVLAGPFLLATHSDSTASGEGKSILAGYAKLFQLSEAPRTLAAPWFAEGLLAAALSTLIIATLATLLDRQWHSMRALRWSLGTIPCLLAWFCGAGILAGLVDVLAPDTYASGIITGICYGFILLLPFIFLRGDAIARDRPPLFWLPAWPGLPAILFAMVALAASVGADLLLNVIASLPLPKALSVVLGVVTGLLSWTFGLMLFAYTLLAWLHRWNWSQLAANVRFPRILALARVLAAQDLELLWLSLWLFFPFLLWIDATVEFTASHIEHIDRLHSGNPPFFWSALLSASRFSVSYWWLGCLLMYGTGYCWILLTARARSMLLAEATEDPGHA